MKGISRLKSRLHHIIRFLSALQPGRLLNYAKLYTSYVYSRLLSRPCHWGMPVALSVEPTTACNLRCPECPSGLRAFTRDTGRLAKPLFSAIIDQLSPYVIHINFYFQGEPYLNPDFLDMVAYAKSRRIYTSSSTNAHFLNNENCKKTIDSGLDELIISIDGTTQETYASYRKEGQLDTVIKGTETLIAMKQKMNIHHPKVIFQFLVVKPNQDQIPEIRQLARRLGVDELRLKSAQVYDFENGNPLIPDNPRYSRYKKMPDGRYTTRHPLVNRCWKMWHGAVITWDGMVVPCCFDKDAQHVMGHLKDQEFKKIWRSPNYNRFRNQLFQGRDKIEICANCTEGCQVWL